MYNNSWTVEQTKRLFTLAEQMTSQGKGLSEVFEIVANETGRQAGSVRNYYYSHMHTLSIMPELCDRYGIKIKKAQAKPFETFSDGEAEQLVSNILIMMADGESVRSASMKLADNDPKLALRLQNKYRSIVCRQPKRAKLIIDNLRKEGTSYFNPYTKTIVSNGLDAEVSLVDTREMIEKAAKKAVDPDIALILDALSRIVEQLDQNTAASAKDRQIALLHTQKSILESRLEKLRAALDANSVDEARVLSHAPNTKISDFEEYLKALDNAIPKAK